jgi:molybdopterin converting factor small subunit
MHISVEFAGIARVVTGERQTALTLDAGTTYREILRVLSVKYPTLIGEVLKSDGVTLFPSNMLNRNGKRMIQPSQMNDVPQDGDRLILMSVLAGG